ncbi:MAG: histidine kinase, partial [Planctomycetota bacterium]
MAGIGFEIGKVLKKDTYLSTFQGYFYGALISSGPWIFTVTSLLFLNLWSENFLDEKSRFLFQGTVTFSFALSLILTGPLQMSLSRYLADHLYRKEFLSLMPSFLLS